jgi:hypothetical protein
MKVNEPTAKRRIDRRRRNGSRITHHENYSSVWKPLKQGMHVFIVTGRLFSGDRFTKPLRLNLQNKVKYRRKRALIIIAKSGPKFLMVNFERIKPITSNETIYNLISIRPYS